jgi:hypothetical protein
MADKVKRVITVTADHSVILYENKNPREGSFISIVHNPNINHLPGEVLIAPGDIPSLVKALTEAALELTGHSDGTKHHTEIFKFLHKFAAQDMKKKPN